MDSLFDDTRDSKKVELHVPLAERRRPRTLSEILGQDELIGHEAPLARMLANGSIPSMILWGPPGSGKTTLALVLAKEIDADLERLSAVDSGVKELREVLQRSERKKKSGRSTIVFIDEIHRFNKSQQDALLHAVEFGTITLIGATTENPSFEVNAALLSRCQVYRLGILADEQIRKIVQDAIDHDTQLQEQNIVVSDWDALLQHAQGDARTALNTLEAAALQISPDVHGERVIDSKVVARTVQRRYLRYDKKGEMHYNVVSAFIKSMRGSDPDAALFYLATMIEAGEDPLFIARRLCIFASEDIGNADPTALVIATNSYLLLERIGMPEGRIVLGQATAYLASAVKSNASYVAIDAALAAVRTTPVFSVPLHLRNAPTSMMKDFGYGKNYQYPHSHDNNFVDENYFPTEVGSRVFYNPSGTGNEQNLRDRLHQLRPSRYDEE